MILTGCANEATICNEEECDEGNNEGSGDARLLVDDVHPQFDILF